ncbi:hypothetical protein G5S34_16940 [Herbaspirillum frisingense]|uniref:hypothetical protein n=1 Tax=Herbaspirillum frisingense TaxID=92645 RepID=UPI0015FFE61E|nr:hypothetical protein [Herbaspirillum frisingense]QNB05319.1 hypothetical protein G5S34_16940 [Herbaspirillum frisingense]
MTVDRLWLSEHSIGAQQLARIVTRPGPKIQACYILQQGCIIMRPFPVSATRLRKRHPQARPLAADAICPGTLHSSQVSAVSVFSRFLLKQGVLASPWWQRVLAVLPVLLLLWLGVHWALGEG